MTTLGERKRVQSKQLASARVKRDALIEKYHGYVERVVGQMIRTLSFPPALRDEFVSAGYLGLVEAASRFDPKRGREFKAFAFLRIRGAIIDYIRSSSHLSGRSYRAFKALEASQSMRSEMLETQGSLGKSRAEEALELLSKSAIAFRLTGVTTDTLVPETSAPDELEVQLDKKRNAEKIRQVVATLPEKERTIIEQYYFHDRKLTDVAAQYAGLSKSWVSRLHDRALSLLKDRFEETLPELVQSN